MFHTWRGLDICVYNDLTCNDIAEKWLTSLHYLFCKNRSSRESSRSTSPSLTASFPSASDMTPCNTYGRFSHMLKQRPYVSVFVTTNGQVCVTDQLSSLLKRCFHGQNMAHHRPVQREQRRFGIVEYAFRLLTCTRLLFRVLADPVCCVKYWWLSTTVICADIV
jgi:hypothetical protein